MSAADDLYVIAIARRIRIDDIVHVGASQLDVWQAAETARRLWAPKLRVVAAGSFHLCGAASPALMRSRTYARDLISARQATFTQSRVFDDLKRTRVAFAGALQVDSRGNANLISFTAKGKIVRGPGSGGLPTLTSHADRFFIALPRHDARSLVAKVDRVSVLGDPRAREALGLPPTSLQAVITPLGAFAPTSDGLALVERTPSVSLEDVRVRTGFAFSAYQDCVERAPITKDEQDALARVRAGLA